MHDWLAQARQIVKIKVNSTHERKAPCFNATRREVSLNPEDLVLWWKPLAKTGISGKLMKKWTGPWLILSKLSPVNYELTSVSRRKKPIVVHVEQLKPYVERDDEIVPPEAVPMLEEDMEITTEESPEACVRALYEVPGSLQEINCDETQIARAQGNRTACRKLRNLKTDGQPTLSNLEYCETDEEERPQRTKRKPERLVTANFLTPVFCVFTDKCQTSWEIAMYSPSQAGSRSSSSDYRNFEILLTPPASCAGERMFLRGATELRELSPVRHHTSPQIQNEPPVSAVGSPKSPTPSQTPLNMDALTTCNCAIAAKHCVRGTPGRTRYSREFSTPYSQTSIPNNFWIGTSESSSEDGIQLEVEKLETKLKECRIFPHKHFETWSRFVMLVWKSQYNSYAPLMMRGLPADVTQSHKYTCYKCGRTTRYWFNEDSEVVAKERCSCYSREDFHLEDIRLSAVKITDVIHKNWMNQTIQICRCEFGCATNDGSVNWFKKHWLRQPGQPGSLGGSENHPRNDQRTQLQGSGQTRRYTGARSSRLQWRASSMICVVAMVLSQLPRTQAHSMVACNCTRPQFLGIVNLGKFSSRPLEPLKPNHTMVQNTLFDNHTMDIDFTGYACKIWKRGVTVTTFFALSTGTVYYDVVKMATQNEC